MRGERHTCDTCRRNWQPGQLARPGVANSPWICDDCADTLTLNLMKMLADNEDQPTPTMGET